MDETTKPSKKECKIRRSNAKRLRDASIIEMATEGRPIKEIAGKVDLHRNTVRDILDSAESRKIIQGAEARIFSLVGKCIDTLEKGLDESATDMNNAGKFALAILKSIGAIKDRVDLTHSFPKPTIITKRNGDQVILGSKIDSEEEDYVA